MTTYRDRHTLLEWLLGSTSPAAAACRHPLATEHVDRVRALHARAMEGCEVTDDEWHSAWRAAWDREHEITRAVLVVGPVDAPGVAGVQLAYLAARLGWDDDPRALEQVLRAGVECVQACRYAARSALGDFLKAAHCGRPPAWHGLRIWDEAHSAAVRAIERASASVLATTRPGRRRHVIHLRSRRGDIDTPRFRTVPVRPGDTVRPH